MEDPILNIEEREAINAGRWFSSLSPSLRHDILRCAYVKRCKDGDLIAARGDPPEEWMACAKGAVRAGMGVAAGDRGARLRDALLGADDVHDALLARGAVEERDPELRAITAELVHHRLRERVAVRLDQLVGRHDVVDRRERAVRHQYLEAEVAQHAEGLRAGHLVDEVGADEELGLAVGERADGVGLPDFFEEGLGRGHEKSVELTSRLS